MNDSEKIQVVAEDKKSIKFNLLLEFTTGGAWPQKHALISCSRGEVLLNDQPCKIMYNGIQLRFSPLKHLGFRSPILSLVAICFNERDPENPNIKDVYEKIKPFLTPEITVESDWPSRDGNDEYDTAANQLIESLRHVKNSDSFIYLHNDKEYNMNEYYHQLKEKTAVGIEFVEDFLAGKKFFELD